VQAAADLTFTAQGVRTMAIEQVVVANQEKILANQNKILAKK
jgi:hypothetical protein